MQKDAPRFELKLREDIYKSSNDKNKNSKQKKRTSNKLTNSCIVCAIILIAVMLLKMSSSSYAGNALERLNELISKQTDFSQTARTVSEVFSQTVNSILPDNKENVSSPVILFASPVDKGTLTKSFDAEKHPVYGTEVAPTYIEITAEAGGFVYAPEKATVTQVSQNADGSLAVSLVISENTAVIFDNLASAYFKAGESVEKKQILGVLPEENAVLRVSVLVDSEYTDPLQYIDTAFITQ